jgi:hypothetical protein
VDNPEKNVGYIRKDNPEKTARAHKGGQFGKNHRASQRLDNPEKTVGAHKKGQPRKNSRGTQGWTIQRKP